MIKDTSNREPVMRKAFHRSIVAGMAAAILATSLPEAPAFAGTGKQPAVEQTTDQLSARRRHYRRGGNAAALAAFAGVAGAIIGLAAESQRRKHYRRHYGYYGYYGNPYAPPPYGYYYRHW
jgi:hypothetical protein